MSSQPPRFDPVFDSKHVVKHLSHSAISLYMDCGRAYWYRYFWQQPMAQSPALAVGSITHDTIAEYVTRKMVGAYERFDMILGERWEKLVRGEYPGRGDEPVKVDWRGDVPDEHWNVLSRTLLAAPAQRVIDAVVPFMREGKPMIETEFLLDVPGMDVPIKGFIDMVLVDGVPCDFKTSSSSWSPAKALMETQPDFYHEALTQMGYGELNPERKFRHIVFVKTRTPSVQVIETTRSPEQGQWALEAARQVRDAIKAGMFPPSVGTWRCSPKYCDFFGVCRHGVMNGTETLRDLPL